MSYGMVTHGQSTGARAVFGGVETGGTWTACALGRHPEDIVARDRFPTADPSETLRRIAAFFRSQVLPAAIGIGSFGPVDPDPSSPHWGDVTSTPKPGWQHIAVAPVIASTQAGSWRHATSRSGSSTSSAWPHPIA
jgi:predicted NBD/HSP70 family sugar kinase